MSTREEWESIEHVHKYFEDGEWARGRVTKWWYSINDHHCLVAFPSMQGGDIVEKSVVIYVKK